MIIVYLTMKEKIYKIEFFLLRKRSFAKGGTVLLLSFFRHSPFFILHNILFIINIKYAKQLIYFI